MRGGLVHRPFQVALIAVTGILLPISFIGADFLRDQPLHHVPTVISLGVLLLLAWRRTFSDWSMMAIVGFVWLHILGARYIYSFVPYDEWTMKLFGISLTDTFGFQRNHYDRLVHFLYGVLATIPQTEVFRRKLNLRLWLTHALSIALVLAVGSLYEIFEWGIAEVMAPDWADRYNGQQGDMWDAQKDMALNGLGALLTSIAMLTAGLPRQAKDKDVAKVGYRREALKGDQNPANP